MTTPQQPRGDVVIEQKHTVKIETTAKGAPHVEVKIVEGSSVVELERIEKAAIDAYNRVREAVSGGQS